MSDESVGVRSTDRRRTTFVAGTVTKVDGSEANVAEPGGRACVDFVLERAVDLEPGIRFAIREGSRTVGVGRVLKVA